MPFPFRLFRHVLVGRTHKPIFDNMFLLRNCRTRCFSSPSSVICIGVIVVVVVVVAVVLAVVVFVFFIIVVVVELVVYPESICRADPHWGK